MTLITSTFTTGGDASIMSPNPDISGERNNYNDDVAEAINYVGEALEAIDVLTKAVPENRTVSDAEAKLLNVAVEKYMRKFDIPNAALESNDVTIPNDDKKIGKLKRVILYLYAMVKRIFQSMGDLMSNSDLIAKKLMPVTKNYIGRSDSISPSISEHLTIKDKSLMVALHVEGVAPKRVVALYGELQDALDEQYKHSSVNELISLLNAARTKDLGKVKTEAVELHAKLLKGVNASLEEAGDANYKLFSEKIIDSNTYWVSKPSFGQKYVTAVVGKDVDQIGTFIYRCNITRDSDTPVRVAAFPVLSPDDIRGICRISLKICEDIVRRSRDEDLVTKAMRQASFIVTAEPDQVAVSVLRDVAASSQSTYIVYLRHTVSVMQSLMRWCGLSLKIYEGVDK